MRRYGRGRGRIPIHYARRDQNEESIVRMLLEVGASVLEINSPGAPDILVGYKGRNWLMEVKTQKGKVRKNQQDWHEHWRGAPVYVVRSAEDALRVLGFTVYG